MPYVLVQVTREPRATPAQKARIIRGVTDLLKETLGKDPESTYVVIEEVELDNWGVGGEPVGVRRERAATAAEKPGAS